MSDIEARELQRAALVGSDSDKVRYVRELIRSGVVGRTTVIRWEALAVIGSQLALDVLGITEPPTVAEYGSKSGCRGRDDSTDTIILLCHDMRRVRTISHEAALRACLAACKLITKRHTGKMDGILEYATGRLVDGPESWTESWLYNNDYARWSKGTRFSQIGSWLDSWDMLLYGFDDSSNWTGARCILHVLAEAKLTEDALRSTVTQELTSWALEVS